MGHQYDLFLIGLSPLLPLADLNHDRWLAPEQAPIAVDRKVYKVVDPDGSSVRFLLVAAGYLLLHSAISSFNPAVEIETEADAFDRVETAVEAAIPCILEDMQFPP